MNPAWQISLQKELEEQRKKVDVDHFDVTIRELVRMAAEGELIRAPTYQRKFRWKEETESRLVESLFLGLPVPSLFVATNADGTWEVVDGLQRLSTLLHYVADPVVVLDSIDKKAALKIDGLEKLEHMNGQTFAELPTPLQLAFLKRSLRVTGLSDKSDKDVRFEMFERLNTGGVALTPQEVRACIYRGKFSDFLRELATYDSFQSLVKLQAGKQDDGTREELVLKFFAYLYDRDSFDGHVTTFLNKYMEESSDRFNYNDARTIFKTATDQVAGIVGGKLLRKGYHSTPLNQLEAIVVGAATNIRAGRKNLKPTDDWIEDEILVKASTKGTNTANMLKTRIERAAALLGAGARAAKKKTV
jgi:Protein of unknown function DUF262